MKFLHLSEKTLKSAKTNECYKTPASKGKSASEDVRRKQGCWMASSNGLDLISEWSKKHGGRRIKSESLIARDRRSGADNGKSAARNR